MIEAIIFDIGNVFVPWDPAFLYRKLVADEEVLNHLLADVVTLEWHTHHDAGRPMAEGIADLSARYPAYAELIAAFDTRWHETLGPDIPETVEALERLAEQGLPLYALTNFSAEKFPAFRENRQWTRHFRDIVVSGEEGLVKPDPAIFRLAIDRFGVVPERTLFIDDRLDNIRAGEALGLVGHHFVDGAGLLADLERRALI